MARTSPPVDKTFRRKEPDSRLLTRERIADDLQAFQKSGGHIEVLGITQVLKKLDDEGTTTSTAATTPARPGAGSGRRGGR